ncbi:MAG: phytanoyl-CoA dioxygenase family protein [Caulobacterales bacterium]
MAQVLNASPSRRLTDAQVRAYRASGWVRAAGFFSADEAAELANWTDDLRARPEVPGEQMVYYEPDFRSPDARIVQRIEFFCDYHPRFNALVQGDLQAAVADLLGEPAVLFKEKVNFKLPGGAGFEPHQDQQAGWSAYAPLFVTALVSVDAATLANGCLEMAHGPRASTLIGAEWEPLTTEEMRGLDLRAVPTAPGDVLFFDSYAPHASKRNETQEARRILYLTYNRAADGDHRNRYFTDKRASFPPDIERAPGRDYRFRV